MNPKTTTGMALTLLALISTLTTASAQSTAFNYTGYLLDGVSPANGPTDFQFTLYSAVTNGTVLGGPTTLTNQSVNNGIFVVSLDFGASVFNGSARWLEIAARPGGSSNPFTNSLPRQPITAVPYAISANNGVPVGSITAFGGVNVPVGWILCDGRTVSRTTYAQLFVAIGTAWGSGDGSTTFRVPDLRGAFMRGVDSSPVTGDSGRDADRSARVQIQSGGNSGNAVGSYQADELRSHAHNIQRAQISGTGDNADWIIADNYTAGRVSGYGGVINAAGGSETRPKNVYVNYIIKY